MMLISLLFESPLLFLMVAVAILLALSIHEYFHAWMAYYLGDPTAKHAGRLTINPIAHLDPIGTLLLFFIGIGWGKPVPINPLNFKDRKKGDLLVGLAGPGSNFLMALVVGLVLRFIIISNSGLLFFLAFFIWINLVLGLINLMPVPPLDGSHILFALPISENIKILLAKNSLIFLFLAIFFVWFVGIPFILRPLFSLITGSLPLF